jgi:hypothetical protein
MMLPAERCQGSRNSPAPCSIAAMIWSVIYLNVLCPEERAIAERMW